MKAQCLYEQLDRDFIVPQCSDDWSEISHRSYYTESFRARHMGLALDNAALIDRVYTAVFASPNVVDCLIARGVTDALLFTHHPMAWDIARTPVFMELGIGHLRQLRERRISLYNLHVPLDRNSDFSTSVNLAHAVGANVLDGFYDYRGCEVAVIAQVPADTIYGLQEAVERAIGHGSKLYAYGDSQIKNGITAFCAGGGNQPELYEIMASKGANAYVTGIASADTGYAPAIEAHQRARHHRINILSGTHYSTEKFACIKMTEYFTRHGLPCAFVEDIPCLADM